MFQWLIASIHAERPIPLTAWSMPVVDPPAPQNRSTIFKTDNLHPPYALVSLPYIPVRNAVSIQHQHQRHLPLGIQGICLSRGIQAINVTGKTPSLQTKSFLSFLSLFFMVNLF
jgi:hypothetical protein